jgi:hypothetical protein
MRNKLCSVALMSLLITGCTAQQPKWVTEPAIGECTTSIGEDCLARLINERFKSMPASLARDEAAIRMNAISHASKLQVSDLVVEPAAYPLTAFIASSNAFAAAGDAIAPMLSGKPSQAVEAALKIKDKDAAVFALLTIISLSDETMEDQALGKALNKLSDLNKQAYLRGLQGRVAGLLVKGDLERANALRDYLLKNDIGARANTFASVTQIAASYAMAGLAPDATATFREELPNMPESIKADNAQFFRLVIKASAGDYPAPQDFHELSTDQARLDAYLLLSALYRRNHKMELATRSLNEAVLFTQKSGFNVAMDQALTQLATSSLGVL